MARALHALRGVLALLCLICSCSGQAAPQGGGAPVPAAVQTALLEMASQAGVIFAGHVLSITRADGSGFVDVRFHVDQTVRGVAKTGAYVLREWAGLWSGQPDRYHVGQGYLMLLTSRGSSGMSSPVGGLDGAIPLMGSVQPPLARGTGVAPPDGAKAAAEAQIDLRWVNALALRSVGGAAAGSLRSGLVRPRSLASGGEWKSQKTAVPPLPVAVPGEGSPVEPGTGRAGSGSSASDQPGGEWIGPIAPLAGPGGSGKVFSATAGSGVPLSSVLALLQRSSGSVHEGR